MNDKINNGGPAFPVPAYVAQENYGMSLRDWFAGQVDVSTYKFQDVDQAARILNIAPPFDDSEAEFLRFTFRAQAVVRYAIADAMLAARDGKL